MIEKVYYLLLGVMVIPNALGTMGSISRQAYINLTLTRRDNEETTVDKLRIERGQQAEDDNDSCRDKR